MKWLVRYRTSYRGSSGIVELFSLPPIGARPAQPSRQTGQVIGKLSGSAPKCFTCG